VHGVDRWSATEQAIVGTRVRAAAHNRGFSADR
jgi:hypothetical protein